MRRLAAPFVVTPPTGARIRTRLHPSAQDEAVLRVIGEHLGRLAGQDLAVRCRLGTKDEQRAARKRALTPACSSRWAGAITRTANDQWERGWRNLLDARSSLRRSVRKLRGRLAVPAGGRRGRVRGYASRAERFAKQRRLQRLEAQLAAVEKRLIARRVSVCRGGRRLATFRHALDRDDMPLTEQQWRTRWEAQRWFLTADGEADMPWGTRPSGCTRMSNGWRSDCRPRWRTCPTHRVGHRPTGWRARRPLPTVGMSGQRRRPAARFATTLPLTRPRARAGGIWMRPGGCRYARCRHLGICASSPVSAWT